MTDDLESRIKALEEKLNPSPDKMSTMKASNRLKQMLDDKKGEKESQEDVVWRLNEQAEKLQSLETMLKHATRFNFKVLDKMHEVVMIKPCGYKKWIISHGEESGNRYSKKEQIFKYLYHPVEQEEFEDTEFDFEEAWELAVKLSRELTE